MAVDCLAEPSKHGSQLHSWRAACEGEETLEQALVPGWEFIQKMTPSLSEEEFQTLASLLEKVRGEAFEYLNPGQVMEEVQPSDANNISRLLARGR